VDAPNAPSGEPEVPNVAVTQEGQPKVAFLGDSIATGQFLAAEQAFPRVLQRKLQGRGSGFRLLDAAVSGETTSGALQRVDAVLGQRPDIVVIELGLNDASEAVPVASVAHNLRAIASRVKAAGAQVLLLGVSATPDKHGDRAAAAAYARELEAIYPSLAEELEVMWVPHFMQGVTGHRELTLPDGVHPTPEGHERIASNVVEPLYSLLVQTK
jgi:acyl-CoA thioesterase I